jgi:hypothetical protein
LSVKEFTFKPTTREEITPLIEKWHYSHSVNGVNSTYCFGLYDEELIGGAILGQPALPNVVKRYSEDGRLNLVELRRLACIDDTPKNTESYFIGHIQRWLKENTDVDRILSYADSTHNHTGVIYKATNFKYLGQTRRYKMIEYNNKTYHPRLIWRDDKPFAKEIKEALKTNKASYIYTKPKHIYIYDIPPNH